MVIEMECTVALLPLRLTSLVAVFARYCILSFTLNTVIRAIA
jgi:hypothetical protein